MYTKSYQPPQLPIYFDTAATTQVDPLVSEAMSAVLNDATHFANPSSTEHNLGRQAEEYIEDSRALIANEFNCEPDEVVFTCGATESINLALRGVMDALALHAPEQKRHIITSTIEHSATAACCSALEQTGTEVTYLDPAADGRINPQSLRQALTPETVLISLIHTSNEVGTIQPIEEIAAIAAEHGVILHVDAAQAAGKMPIDMAKSGIDMLSLSAHKFHGPKGSGCLIIRDRQRLPIRPLCFGGGQEFGLRPGTLATHQIVGLSKALELAAQRRAEDLKHVSGLRQRFLGCLQDAGIDMYIHTPLEYSSPYIINFAIAGIPSSVLINQTREQIAIASGSACSSGSLDPSPILRAMGVEGDPLYGAVRVSFSRQHTEAEIDYAAAAISNAAQRVKQMR
ncbi:cysteine desulfurase [Halorhodospira halochloris]|uniref:cysteine desulfurase family protein n=1 Tax=Halorhodospira halochloris TaxID=1052 RepID=UPI001EE819CC|nr:cysteine desulfurase family protein [Halorhodospira halochloris]MCG5531016.1 cysteine desulfurase [Halorhodospira halochloris]